VDPAPDVVLIHRIDRLVGQRANPLVVALDGWSGAGKSTLAVLVAERTGAAVICGDDFYAGGTPEHWDAMKPSAKVAHCVDWRRQRSVLTDLANGRRASWLPYDWEHDDGSFSGTPLTCEPASVVILEGAYSARPELADLLDLRVLLDVPKRIRRQRLLQREADRYRAEWEDRWAAAEEHYFTHVMPPCAFDLVLGH
jgi:uridine kinase